VSKTIWQNCSTLLVIARWLPVRLLHDPGCSDHSATRTKNLLINSASVFSEIMLSRIPRAVSAPCFLSAFRISRSSLPAASFHFNRSNGLRSSARCLHITPPSWGAIMPEPPDPMPNNVSPPVAEATSLSDERFHELVDLCFEAVLGSSWEIQQHGSNITVESSVRSYLLDETPISPTQFSLTSSSLGLPGSKAN